MKIICPFLIIFGDRLDCLYLDERDNCDEIEVNPGNDDAWCTKHIEHSLEDEGGK